MIKFSVVFFVVATVSGCASSGMEKSNSNESLTKFAYANCLMWYFESKKYNTDDIRAISGGIVETSRKKGTDLFSSWKKGDRFIF